MNPINLMSSVFALATRTFLVQYFVHKNNTLKVQQGLIFVNGKNSNHWEYTKAL